MVLSSIKFLGLVLKGKKIEEGLCGEKMFNNLGLAIVQNLQTATLPVLYETLKGEGKDGMRKVELELLNRLEVLMTKKQEEENRDEFFEDIISTQFPECLDVSPEEETSIEQNTDQKMSQELMKILVDYRSANSEGNLSLKIMCTHRLMDFYQRSKEFDMFFKCIHKLSDLHLECGCFTEAALALKVHADNHEWKEDVRLEEFLIFPTQTEWERKEALCLKIIEHFNEGKEWEMALLLCNELMEQYKQKKQFRKLAEIMHKQGNLYEAILDKTRQPPTYFKVSFYGKGFPQYLKDEVLVYRGQELETLAGFTSRICTQFPTVKVIYKNGRPDDEILKSDGQHIQICTVLPISEDADEFIQSFNEDTQAYYRINNVEKFSFNRPFHRGEKDPKNEFKTLWLERTTQTVENKFPNILRWSRIVKDEKIELPPIVNAIEMICSKNKELQSKVDDFAPLMKSNASQLSMVLNGVIDANVNGGIANYQSAFLSPEYLEENPKDKEKVEELKEALIEQSNILNDGLKIHEYYVNESLRPFHDKMMLMYSAMKISIETGKPMELDLLSSMNNTLSARSMSMPGGRVSPRPKISHHSHSEDRSMSISHSDTNNGTASVAQPKERRKSLAALTGFTNKKLRKQSEVDGGRKSKKKEKESGGGMGGLSSLLGALHEENTSRPTSIFSETFDLGMLETYSQSARPSPSPSPSPFPNSSDSGTSTPSGLSTPSRASTPSSESKQLTFVYTNNDVNKNKQKEDRLENGKASNGDLNNNHIGEAKIKGTIISVESTSTPLKDEPKKKPRQLAKVSIKSKSKSHLSGKEYTF